ncbi:TetR/AcrR family transcriptional regulator [Streptomyces lonarensis]|uniref:TetR/AcrR family transcriptional regulator n=1 Tax=Streptomyces lonarensis TaxID=700599 RepID=A0A7X6I188_9ACTN|nr:TetR/AcrR family transcriptional regulator [Streptomyces lonarensis]NJQ08069.1 TetR/AcrR family transcriptional regulator [Streptomyces lonarensis]
MPDPNRVYRSKLREDNADRTRRQILDAARDLFVPRGYARVTVADIAAAAGVAVKTVYASVGTKPEILHRLIAADVADSRAEESVAAARDADDLPAALSAVAGAVRRNTERFTPSIDLLLSASAGDDRAREVWGYVLERYREALREVARHLVSARLTAPHLDTDAVADRLWLCFGLSSWRVLVGECGWGYDAAEELLTRQALSLLQDPEPLPVGSGPRSTAPPPDAAQV